LCTSSLKEEKMRGVHMWSLRPACGDVCAILEQQTASRGDDDKARFTWKRAKRDVLRQYSIKLIYFLNHCCLSGCRNVYGRVVLA
jgi:hypothetical protein